MPSAILPPTLAETTDLLRDLTDLFENATIGLQILNADGTVERANRAQRLLAGRSVDGLDSCAGAKPEELLSDEEWIRLRSRLEQDGVARNLPVLLRRPDAEPQPVIMDANIGTMNGRVIIRSVMRPALFAHRPGGADDSDAAAWEQALQPVITAPLDPVLAAADPQPTIDYLQDFFDGLPVAMHQVSPQGLMVRANHAQLRMLGHEAEPNGFLEQDATIFFPVVEQLNTMVEAFLTGRSISNYAVVVQHSDGRNVPVTVFSSPIIEPTTVATRCFLFVR